ncbi:ras-related protein Rap-1b-like [Tubulanus polymorphus]|uniref:ras-related protein Rap-1b-like n=1 Tax=Tubulanus polymorphus TaxID=672921 RepID=UPI003DA39FAD
MTSERLQDELRFRLVLLGAGNVGKSSILHRFLSGTFSEKYKQTVEDLYCREYEFNGLMLKVDYLDTAGNFAFPAMRRLSISQAHAFILVFSLDDRASFSEVQRLREQIKELRTDYQDIPLVVVGNKSDLDLQRLVGFEEVADWIEVEGLQTSYVETSAKHDDGIADGFQLLWDSVRLNLELEIAKHPLTPTTRKRRISAFAVLNPSSKSPVRNNENKLNRSRSLMRRSSKNKLKAGNGEAKKIDCIIS